MFVRWKRRKLAQKDPSCPPQYSLYAVLVENQRIDGKTMQRVVKYLAYINDGEVRNSAEASRFWDSVDRALEGLDISSELRQSIDLKLGLVVPRVTPGTSPGLSSGVPNGESKRAMAPLL